jgi:hypothetical protein
MLGTAMNVHKTVIHARCPYAPVWDYYTLVVRIDAFIRTEDIQKICDEVRGQEMTQEDVADRIEAALPPRTSFTLKGRHGQNGRLIITR